MFDHSIKFVLGGGPILWNIGSSASLFRVLYIKLQRKLSRMNIYIKIVGILKTWLNKRFESTLDLFIFFFLNEIDIERIKNFKKYNGRKRCESKEGKNMSI